MKVTQFCRIFGIEFVNKCKYKLQRRQEKRACVHSHKCFLTTNADNIPRRRGIFYKTKTTKRSLNQCADNRLSTSLRTVANCL